MSERASVLFFGALICAAAACSEVSDGGDAGDTPDGGMIADGGGDGGGPPGCACDADDRACDEGCACDERCGAGALEEPCRVDGDCAEDLGCALLGEDESSVCMIPCSTEGVNAPCPARSACVAVEERGQDANGNGRRDHWCLDFCQPGQTPQSTCGDGRACYLTAMTGGVCLDDRGGGQNLEPCDGTLSCGGGRLCPPAEEEGAQRLCIQLCDPSGAGALPPCAQGESCLRTDDTGGAGICVRECSDLAANDCPGGHTCLDPGNGSPRICVPAGEKPAGQPCSSWSGECVEGTVCFGNCVDICDMRVGDEDCPNQGRCVGDASAEVGFCLAECRDPFDAEACGAHATCQPFGFVGLCVPAGERPAGSECGGPGQCAVGTACSLRTCVALCDVNHPCPQDLECVDQPGSGVGQCVEPCDDVVGGTGCAAPKGCRIVNTAADGACIAGGDTATGEACADTTECAPGNLCLDAEMSGTQLCRKLCLAAADPTAEGGCGEGVECLADQGPLGICAISSLN